MAKKLLVLLLCMFMLAVPVAAADYEELSFEASDYQDEISFFVSTGILDVDDSFITSDDWTVSRAEFVRLAIISLNLGKYAEASGLKSSFTDMNGNPYNSFVAVAESGKLMGEIQGLLFNPDEPLTADFAAQLGVAMTGRSALIRGDKSPMMIASGIKLFKNVETYDQGMLNRGNALKFLKNVLLTDVMQAMSFSSGGKQSFSMKNGATVLYNCFGLEKREGVITSDGVTTVFGDHAREGRVGIDGKIYPAYCTDYPGMAGQKVQYFVEVSTDGYEVVKCVEAIDNVITTVRSRDIQSFDKNSVSYKVFLDNKVQTLSVDRKAFVAYNFKADYNPDRMVPVNGVVTFIDHNDDGICEVVLIYDFVNIVADFYSDYSNTIYDKEDSTKNIDLSLFNSYSVVDVANNPMELSKIQRHNIISLYQNPEEKTARLVVSANKKTGILKSINVDMGTCTVGSSEYKLSQDVRFTEELKPGNSYEYYFDAFGEVAYVISDGGTMAYLLQGRREGSLSTTIHLRVLPETTKKMTEYQLADKVYIQKPDAEPTTLSALDAYETVLTNRSGVFVTTMSVIGFNGEGKINKIVFPMEISTYAQVDTAPKYPLYYLSYIVNEWPTVLKSSTNMVYKTGINGFNRWVIFGNDAKIFYAPPVGADITEPDAYVVKAPSYDLNQYVPTAGKTYYSKDLSDLSVRYMLESSPAQTDFSTSRPGAVTEITQVFDDKLGVTNRISVMTMSGIQTFLTAEQDVILGQKLHGENIRVTKTVLEVGDVIRWLKNESGNVSAIELMWDSQKGIRDSYNDNGDTAARFGMQIFPVETKWDPSGDSMTVGNITKKSGNIVEYVIDKTDTTTSVAERRQRIEWNIHNTGSVFDFSGQKVKISHSVSANELVVGDRLVLISYSGQVYNVFVYRR